ncbi:unnamed protein product [Allacma fusca]|uniref:Helitron helicase-like domain-containing protein n=1 Tax=Allacma fusca TaxID=39272 RepID=A0A8J2PQK2_9HEXA|nr:unnamed protein product [Allacma fusca]
MLNRRMGYPEKFLSIRVDKTNDQRRYNAPRFNEVAVVFRSDDGEPPFGRDIRVYSKTETKGIVIQNAILNDVVDPMVYPILFPFGDRGWQPGILKSNVPLAKHIHITLMEYYAYRFSVRDEFNPFLMGGKLTQQRAVDAYAKTEANQLHWLRTHQKDLRV